MVSKEKNEIISTTQQIDDFIKSKNKKVLEIEYTGEDLNPTKFYSKVLLQHPIKFITNALIIKLASILPPCEIKSSMYRLTGMKVGKDVNLAFGIQLDGTHPELITIEDGAMIGFGSKILVHEMTAKRLRIGRVQIGKQVVLGADTLVRCGVKVGDYSVVGAKSFVNKDVGKYEMVGGVPAKHIKTLSEIL